MRGRVHILAVGAAVLGVAGSARALPCLALRPTAPAAAWSYAGAKTASLDTPQGNVRIWFATEGPHAPSGVSAAEPPEAALLAGAAAEAALERYDALGFERPLTDAAASPCIDNGGDGRLDVYLFDFKSSADGTVVRESCTDDAPRACVGFALVENDFASGAYASAAEGFRTVVPHELFHLVQSAYSSNDETWWSEGTAQWATKQVFPELLDLERFLPAFFAHPERPLDFPALGPAASISYGAAIWPVFLADRYSLDLPRQVFARLDESVLGATAAALNDQQTSLADAFAEFARWNVATGARAALGGYSQAALYPELALQAVTPDVPQSFRDQLAGLSARYFALDDGLPRRLEISGNAQRVAAWFVPLVDGLPELTGAQELPLVTVAPGIVVVTGRATDHRDVAFSVDIDIAEAPEAESPVEALGGAAGAPNDVPASNGGVPAAGPEIVELPAGDQPVSTATPDGDISNTGSPTEEAQASSAGLSRASGGCSLAAPTLSRPLQPLLLALGVAFSFARRSSLRRLTKRSLS